MADNLDIRRALEKRLGTMTDVPAIAWENVDFDPKEEDSWLRVSYVPVEARETAVGAGAQVKNKGLFLVDCFVKKTAEGGPADADALADLVISRFRRQTLTENGATVVCMYAERSQGIDESPWFFVPVKIEWFCYT